MLLLITHTRDSVYVHAYPVASIPRMIKNKRSNMFEISGDIVRISPNELSLVSVESWKAIYGHPVAGRATMIKSEFYDMYGSGFDSLCIGSERKPHIHSRMRKSLTPAFSTKALVEQESIVHRCIDEFVEKIGEQGIHGKHLNMTKWFEMLAFDILGEMAFGESFNCIKKGKIFGSSAICSNG